MKFDPEVNPILDYIKSNSDPAQTRNYAFHHAVSFYDQRKYFEAHEIFEFQWKKESGDLKVFLQALIQIAVAMNKLYININLNGALSQAKLALAKLLYLIDSNIFTEQGFFYVKNLTKSMKDLIVLLEKPVVNYSDYLPPKLLEEVEELFL